jgi:hypothetical protein
VNPQFNGQSTEFPLSKGCDFRNSKTDGRDSPFLELCPKPDHEERTANQDFSENDPTRRAEDAEISTSGLAPNGVIAAAREPSRWKTDDSGNSS